jgi:uncharacterized cupin superfamily protein
MSDKYRPLVTISDLNLLPFSQGSGYESGDAGISDQLRLTQLGATYTEVPPGKTACPFHVHRVEDEMFVILEGRGEYRFGEEMYPVSAGDVLGAPRGGRELAHQLTNTGDQPLKYLAISSKAETEVCEYPDSDKFLVLNRADPGFRFIGRQADGLDYWDGERDS